MQVSKLMTFVEWMKLKEDFHQGAGAMGASLPLKPKLKGKQKNNLANPMFNIDRGQSYQGTKKDDGNG